MSDKPVHTYVTYIATDIRKAWNALLDPSCTEKYFFGRRVQYEPRAGGTYKLLLPDGSIDVGGTIQEFVPFSRLRILWHVEWSQEYQKLPPVEVLFQLDDLGNFTGEAGVTFMGVVRLTLEEFHPTPIDERYHEGGRRGWPLVLSGMKTLLETGKPLPKFNMDQMAEAPVLESVGR